MLTFFFSILREIVSHNLLNLTIHFIKVTLNIVLFVKTKMSLFHQIFFGFMSRMHKLQIFREKLQFSCIAFRLENPTQALPSRHWFHHHNSQCFFFFFNCHVTVVPKSCCLNMLDICLRVFDGTTMICVTIFLVIFANDVKKEEKIEEKVAKRKTFGTRW